MPVIKDKDNLLNQPNKNLETDHATMRGAEENFLILLLVSPLDGSTRPCVMVKRGKLLDYVSKKCEPSANVDILRLIKYKGLLLMIFGSCVLLKWSFFGPKLAKTSRKYVFW